MSSYSVIDVETSIKGASMNKASAFWKDNKVALWGVKFEGYDPTISAVGWEYRGADKLMLVGHNIKFDLHHMRRQNKTVPITSHIWDTQLAEYLLTGQQTTYARLDDLAVKYGGSLKDSRVSDLFKAGIGADEIDKTILTPYLEQDLINTEKVFLGQFVAASEQNMLPLIFSQMRALAATTEMSWNGLYIDKERLEVGTKVLQIDCAIAQTDMVNKLIKWMPVEFAKVFNVSSNKQMAALLFGGVITRDGVEEVGVYKSGVKKGLPKTKKIVVEHTLMPLFTPKLSWKTEKGSIRVDREVLEQCANLASQPKVKEFLRTLLDYNDKEKQLSTYFLGVKKALYDDGYIHQELNHCVTSTGRLSSSAPNLQNITNGPIKAVFTSRWGEEGRLVEIDYGQLEIVGLACVSGDVQLIHDITDNIDVHTALYKDMHGRNPTKEERKAFKPLTFGLVYGAGANTLAANAKCSKEEAKRFVETFYRRYRGVKAWHDSYKEAVERERRPSSFRDVNGMPVGASVMQDYMTGRKYVYKEYPSPDWIARTGKTHSFSPTEMKNYPVQGFATGDIVPMMLGEVFDGLMKDEVLKNNCLMVNTVHDSLLFDVSGKYVEKSIDFLRNILENTPLYFKERFGVTLPFKKTKVGVSVGHDWLNCIEI